MSAGSHKLDFPSLEEGIERMAKKYKTSIPKSLKDIDELINLLNSTKQTDKQTRRD
eukprot:TRINITY_DN6041_c0_g1_i1.p1 TRINITY_DN6041_c0_g1~~TRINITY_DN6041_c0_g1_i1.p1  ORF type:complete len:56 (+),score=11.28 TRINITY_DN6041_c0_g1_i1:249-416(+)